MSHVHSGLRGFEGTTVSGGDFNVREGLYKPVL